jgi:glycerophosphoryl diester phosphodiesterase
MTDRPPHQPDETLAPVPISVDGPHGPIRLKWHKLRTHYAEAPFKRSNLTLGWRRGASLEIDILASADHRFVVAHDMTLGPSTTGSGRITRMPAAAVAGSFHRDRDGVADPDAPVLSLADLVSPLRSLERAPEANLQLDLKVNEGHTLSEAAIADAATAVAHLEQAIMIGSYHLDEARRLASAMPGARLGYDPMRAVSREHALAHDSGRLFRHIERRRKGVSIAYLQYGIVVASERRGFSLVDRLLDLGIETDAWTINPDSELTDSTLRTLVAAKVRQITTDAPTALAGRIAAL